MDIDLVTQKFAAMGARLKVDTAEGGVPLLPRGERSGLIAEANFSLNVLGRGKNQYFEIPTGPGIDVEVLELDKAERHLLLMLRSQGHLNKVKFLCGHDEREWFAAALPEDRPVRSIATAMEALKPAAVVASQQRRKVRTRGGIQGL